MQKIDLLPCPFCGSPAKLCSSKANAAGTRFVFWVHCDFRGDLNCDVIPTTPKFDTAEQAVKAWNTRASGWIPCSERMPGRFDTVLIAILSKNGYGEPAYYVTIGGMKNGNEFESYTGDICECETVTHWMPLPAMPEVINNVV